MSTGVIDEVTFATKYPNRNMCQPYDSQGHNYFSKVIEYMRIDRMRINYEIDAIIRATNFISAIPDASDYVIYPILNKSCGAKGLLLPPLPASLPPGHNIAAIFVMKQCIPLTKYIESIKTPDTKQNQILADDILSKLLTAARWLDSHKMPNMSNFHGDVKLDNLVYDDNKVKFIDYAPDNKDPDTNVAQQQGTDYKNMYMTFKEILRAFDLPHSQYTVPRINPNTLDITLPNFNQPSRFMQSNRRYNNSPEPSSPPPPLSRFQRSLFQESPPTSSKRPASTTPSPPPSSRLAKTLF